VEQKPVAVMVFAIVHVLLVIKLRTTLAPLLLAMGHIVVDRLAHLAVTDKDMLLT